MSVVVRRDVAAVRWACRMECDIDFHKHFAWLRKVGRLYVFSSLLLLHVVRFATATVWNSANAVAMEDNVGEIKHVDVFGFLGFFWRGVKECMPCITAQQRQGILR